MPKHLHQYLQKVYQTVYVWPALFASPRRRIQHHAKLLFSAEAFTDPAFTPILNTCLVHLMMSGEDLFGYLENINTSQRDICRRQLTEQAFDLIEEIISDFSDCLSQKSRALLYETLYWLSISSDRLYGQTALEEDVYAEIRNNQIAKTRQKAMEYIEYLDDECKAICIASLSIGQLGKPSKYITQYDACKSAWLSGKSDEFVYTFHDQINKNCLGSTYFWRFDQTVKSLLMDLSNNRLGGYQNSRSKFRKVRQQKISALSTIYEKRYPDRDTNHLMDFSIDRHGYRVHAIAALKEMQIIDDIIACDLDEKTKRELLYKFDVYFSSSEALAKFKSRLTRMAVPLTVPMNSTDIQKVLSYDAFLRKMAS